MKLKTIFIGIFILFAVFSCDKEENSLEVTNSPEATSLRILQKTPSISGPSCALPGSTAIFTLVTTGITNIMWDVEGNASVLGPNNDTNVTIVFATNWDRGFVTLDGTSSNGLRYSNKIEVRRCLDVDPCADFWLGIPDGYVDGPAGGTDEIFLMASGNYPAGTTYSWRITRQDGSINPYNASTANPRRITASFANKIVRAEVTANYEDCEETAFKIYNPPIPDTENPFGG